MKDDKLSSDGATLSVAEWNKARSILETIVGRDYSPRLKELSKILKCQ